MALFGLGIGHAARYKSGRLLWSWGVWTTASEPGEKGGSVFFRYPLNKRHQERKGKQGFRFLKGMSFSLIYIYISRHPPFYGQYFLLRKKMMTTRWVWQLFYHVRVSKRYVRYIVLYPFSITTICLRSEVQHSSTESAWFCPICLYLPSLKIHVLGSLLGGLL